MEELRTEYEIIDYTLDQVHSEILGANGGGIELDEIRNRLAIVTSLEKRMLGLFQKNRLEGYHSKEAISTLTTKFLSAARENWSRQAIRHPVVHLDRQKVIVHKAGDGLEPRQYMCLNPEVPYQFDDLSLATAKTPALQTQPYHYHKVYNEINFFDGESNSLFSTSNGMQKLKGLRGSMTKMHPGSNHTISNLTSEPVLNLTIKPTNAVSDRFIGNDYSPEGGGEIIIPEVFGNKFIYYIADKNSTNYRVLYSTHSEGQVEEFCGLPNSIVYILEGEFSTQMINGEKSLLKVGDMFITSPDFNRAILTCLSESGRIYHAIKT
jgi:hypothetical protein